MAFYCLSLQKFRKIKIKINLYVSEFFPTFFLMDHIFQEKIPFEGNFTIKVVGGGIGYEENIKYFTEEEIASYNYIPGERYLYP